MGTWQGRFGEKVSGEEFISLFPNLFKIFISKHTVNLPNCLDKWERFHDLDLNCTVCFFVCHSDPLFAFVEHFQTAGGGQAQHPPEVFR